MNFLTYNHLVQMNTNKIQCCASERAAYTCRKTLLLECWPTPIVRNRGVFIQSYFICIEADASVGGSLVVCLYVLRYLGNYSLAH